MAFADISRLLQSPRFSDTFMVVRIAQSTDQHGRPAATQTVTSQRGVLQPATGETLMQQPEFANVNGVVEIWTGFPLQAQAPGYAADQVIWQGYIYLVAHVEDFGNWGAGYVHAICTLQTAAAP